MLTQKKIVRNYFVDVLSLNSFHGNHSRSSVFWKLKFQLIHYIKITKKIIK